MKKVVIVEDDKLLAAHLARVLNKADYEAHQVYHAPAAIKLIDELLPEVIVLDMLLGGSTAMPLLNELASHEDLAKIPVVLLTSLEPDLEIDNLRAYGVREILDKASATPADIIASVGAALK